MTTRTASIGDPFPAHAARRRRREWLMEGAIRACGWSAIVFVFAILFFVFREATPAFRVWARLGEFFTSRELAARLADPAAVRHSGAAGRHAPVTGARHALAVPAGSGRRRLRLGVLRAANAREGLKIVIELLAAIPSVVWGFVGYMVLNPVIIWATGAPIGINVLNGGVILALMSVPIIMSVGEDALKAVPDTYREAALALGASRWQVVYEVLFPAAKNGLLAAVLLGVGRAVGETMAVLMATGHAVQIPHSLLDPVRTLTATIAAELGETRRGRRALPGAVRHRQPAVASSRSSSISRPTSSSRAFAERAA